MASIPSWSDLPLDLLGLVVSRLPYPADRARSRAVCRSWHSAVRRHGQQLPWIFCPDGKVGTLSDGRSHRFSTVSDRTTYVASSDDWLMLGFYHVSDYEDREGQYYTFGSYLLHNEFSNTSIPLPELEFILRGHQRICKLRLRSTADGLVIAALTTNEKYPLILIRPGKGVWWPEPQEQPYINIVDIAFLGETLYAITRAEDLIPLCLTSDADGKPMVTVGRSVIRKSSDYHGYDQWAMSDDDEEEVDDDDDDDEQEEEGGTLDDDDDIAEKEESVGTDVDDDDNGAKEEDGEEASRLDDDNDGEQEEEGTAALSGDDDDDDDEDDDDGDDDDDDDDEEEEEEEDDDDEEDDIDAENNIDYLGSYQYTSDGKIIYWHLVETGGKLVMVRSHRRDESICSVDVFEADMDTRAWVPMVSGLGGGRALLVGINFSKFVSAPCGKVKEDTIYFIETGDVFNMKTRTCNLQRFCNRFCWGYFPNFLFPPELVI